MVIGLDGVLALYRSEAAQARYDESVTALQHALQCATLAEQAGAGDALIAAALLHDVGHLILGDRQPIDQELTVDHRHEAAGAGALALLFGLEVAEPVRWHVAAKRYLCATDPAYHDLLSPASARSLTVQGGPMSEAEVAVFETAPHAEQAVQLRRWDDEAKAEGLPVPSMDNWERLLQGLLLDVDRY